MRSHKKRLWRSAALAVALSALAASPAHAHGFGLHDAGLLGGLVHPFLGLDHVLAMVAVGLLAAQAGRGRRLRAPGAFVAATAAGFVVAAAGTGLPHLEAALLLSVLGLGALVAAGADTRGVVLTVLAVFGAVHGMAHGAELAGSAGAAGLGMVTATAALHATGLGAGVLMARTRGLALVRLSGAGVAAAGVAALLI
jgi:urease accessory protein